MQSTSQNLRLIHLGMLCVNQPALAVVSVLPPSKSESAQTKN